MKELIKRLFIVFLLFQTFSIISFGQYQFVDYVSGYYITNTNDTLRGFIGLPSFPDSSKIILYKSDESSIPELVRASEAKLYKRNSTAFISKELKLTNKVDSFFVKPIIEDKLSLYTLWIHVYEIPDYQDKRYLYLTEREGITVNLDDLPNYFKKTTIIKLENSDCLVLPDRQSNYIISKYLSAYPSFALKIINNEFGKDEIELLVKEFNNRNNNDVQIIKQDSIASIILDKKLNKFSQSKLSIEIPVAFNLIGYNHLSIQDIDDLYLSSINLQNSFSFGIGLKYSIFNSLKFKVGWQTDQTALNLDYIIANADTVFYSVKEAFGIRRNTGYLSLINEGKFLFVGGGIELEKYSIKSTNKTHNNLSPDDALYHPLPEINFVNNTKVNFQLFAGLKIYTNYGLRINPYIGLSHPLIMNNELYTDIRLKEITAGLIFEYKILNID